MDIDPILLAWAAGIVDGEGHISIRHLRPRVYQLEVGVTNTDPRLMQRFLSLFGGYTKRHGKNALSKKPCWTWCVCSKQAEAFLLLIRPYLFIKAEQADIGLASRALITRNKKDRTVELEQFAWLKRQLTDVRKEH